MSESEIPRRAFYKAAEVCTIAGIQSYVLRTWEQEFPNLGVPRSNGGPRVYRQSDLEQVLEIKRLLFEEGLTLAGARRRLEERDDPQPELPLDDLVTPELKERLSGLKQGLRDLLSMLSNPPGSGIRGGNAVTRSAEKEGGATRELDNAAPAPRKASRGGRSKRLDAAV